MCLNFILQITIDGVDIQYYNIMWLRSQMCFISYETLFFPLSILNNFQLVKPGCTLSDVEEVCKTADIHDRILQLPKVLSSYKNLYTFCLLKLMKLLVNFNLQGYDTIVIGENQDNSFNFQELVKLSIARALLIKPRILLIDEKPIINDEHLENVVLKMIHKLRGSSTIVIAASRANAVMKHCDHIYYFENGEVCLT